MSSDQLVAYAAKRRRSKLVKRIAITVASVVAVLVLGAGAYYLWFTASLNDALGRNANDDVLDVLAESADGEPFYMLLLGSDERRDEKNPEASQRSDVIMLTRVDARNRVITMLSVPRDTRYTLDDGSVVKINELFNIGGAPLAIEGVSKLTGAFISHYGLVYMSDVKNVVNELGGVEVYVENEINNNDPETEENVNVQPGWQMLDGREAQAFAIARHDTEGGTDTHRQEKIRTLITAVIKKTLDRPIADIPATVISLAKYIETDLRADDLIDLARDFATGTGDITFYQGVGPTEGALDEELGAWYINDDPQDWARLMEVMDSGGDPSTVEFTYE